MARALEQARVARDRGEVPVGAVLVRSGRLAAEDHNRTLTAADPTAHAEVLTLRAAAAAQGDFRLEECTLYVTLEPCAMCCGASDPKAGMAGSLGNLLQDPRLNHRCAVTSGVLGEAAGDLLRAFFRERR
jgi:tRNA(adenine34) deaminase